MSFNAKNFIIDKVRRVTQINLETGLVDWTLTSIESPQIEFTGESTDKTDAYGVLLARFDTAKGVNFSGEGSLLSMPLMAAQLGTEVEVADATNKVYGEAFEILKVVTTGEGASATKTAELPLTPKTIPSVVYTLSEDKNIDSTIEVGTGDDKASISGKVITLPASFTGTQIAVFFDYETDEAVKVSDGSENFAEAAKYIVDILAADVCNPSIKRAGSIVFPKAKIDNNFTIDLTTEGTHPFSFSALKDYCADDANLCYTVFRK